MAFWHWKDVSFVYFNVALNLIASIMLIFFFIYAYNERAKIFKRHDTISSFCAEKNSWGSRFLLAFTCIVGVNMLCLHVEEFNSRPAESDPLFWICVAVIFPLPLVGICYTKGKEYNERDEIMQVLVIRKDQRKLSEMSQLSSKDSLFLEEEKENEMVDCGYFSFPISWSESIHDLSAGVFFGGLTFTNMAYTFILVTDPSKFAKSPKMSTALFTASVINVIVLIAFLIINKGIMQFYHRIGDGFVRCNIQKLRIWSFCLECTNGAFVIILSTVCSMKRNNNIGVNGYQGTFETIQALVTPMASDDGDATLKTKKGHKKQVSFASDVEPATTTTTDSPLSTNGSTATHDSQAISIQLTNINEEEKSQSPNGDKSQLKQQTTRTRLMTHDISDAVNKFSYILSFLCNETSELKCKRHADEESYDKNRHALKEYVDTLTESELKRIDVESTKTYIELFEHSSNVKNETNATEISLAMINAEIERIRDICLLCGFLKKINNAQNMMQQESVATPGCGPSHSSGFGSEAADSKFAGLTPSQAAVVGISTKEQMKQWLETDHSDEDKEEEDDDLIDMLLDEFEDTLLDLINIKGYENDDVENLRQSIRMSNLPMTKWKWSYIASWIERSDNFAQFASVFWEWGEDRINGNAFCAMDKRHIRWMIELRHQYNPKLDNITDRDIDRFVDERNRMLLMSVLTYKFETFYKLIARARKKDEKMIKEQAQCNQIFEILRCLRADCDDGPKDIWKLNAFYFNKIDNVMSVCLVPQNIRNLFFDFYPNYLQKPLEKSVDLQHSLTFKFTDYEDEDEEEKEAKEAQDIAKGKTERCDVKRWQQRGEVDKCMDRLGVFFGQYCCCENAESFIKYFDRIYLRYLWILTFALSVGCLFTWFWMNDRARSGIDDAMRWTSENIARRAVQSMEYEFFWPEMMISLAIGGLLDGELKVDNNDYIYDEANDEFFVQYKHINEAKEIIYSMYMVHNESIIGSFTAENETNVFIFDHTTGCGIDYLYDDDTKQRINTSETPDCSFDPSSRPWYITAGTLNVDEMKYTEPYEFREGVIGMSLVKKIENKSEEYLFIVEFSTDTLNSVFSSFGTVVGGMTYLTTMDGTMIASSIGQIDCIDTIISDCSASNELLINSLSILRDDLGAYYSGNFTTDDELTMTSFSLMQHGVKVTVVYGHEHLKYIERAEISMLLLYVFGLITIWVIICLLDCGMDKRYKYDSELISPADSSESEDKDKDSAAIQEKMLVVNENKHCCAKLCSNEWIYDYNTVGAIALLWTSLLFIITFSVWEANVDPLWHDVMDVFEAEEYLRLQDKITTLISTADSIADVVEERIYRSNDFDLSQSTISDETSAFFVNVMDSFRDIDGKYIAQMVYIATPDGKMVGALEEQNLLRKVLRDNTTDYIYQQLGIKNDTVLFESAEYDPRCRNWYKLSLEYMFNSSIDDAFGGDYNTFETFYLEQNVDSGLTSECITTVEHYKSIWNISNVTKGDVEGLGTNYVYSQNVAANNIEYDILWSQYLFASTATSGLSAMRPIVDKKTKTLIAVIGIDFNLDKISLALNKSQSSTSFGNNDWYSWLMGGDEYEMIASSDGQVTIPFGNDDENEEECVEIMGTCFDVASLFPYNATEHPNLDIKIMSTQVSLFYAEDDDLAINTLSNPTFLRTPLDVNDALSARIRTYPSVDNPVELNWILVTTMNIDTIKIAEEDDTKIIGFVLLVTMYAIYRVIDKIRRYYATNPEFVDQQAADENNGINHEQELDEIRYKTLKKQMIDFVEREAWSHWKLFMNQFEHEVGYHRPMTTSMATDFMAKQSNKLIESTKTGDFLLLLLALEFQQEMPKDATAAWRYALRKRILYFVYSKWYNWFMTFIIVAHLWTSLYVPENAEKLRQNGINRQIEVIAMSISGFCIFVELMDLLLIGFTRFIKFGALTKKIRTKLARLTYTDTKYLKQIKKRSTLYLLFFGASTWLRFVFHIILVLLILFNWCLMMFVGVGPFEYWLPLVPILFILRSERIYRFSIQFFNAVYVAKEILISYMILILIVAILASAAFSNILNPDSPVDTYNSSIRALITSFVFVSTGENYNEVVYSAIDQNASTAQDGSAYFFAVVNDNTVALINLGFFVTMSIIGLYFFVPVMIFQFESAFDHSRKINDNVVSKDKNRAKINRLIAGFIWLDMDNTGKIGETEFKLLVNSSVISRNVLLEAFDYDNDGQGTDRNDQITLYEFVSTLLQQSSVFSIGVDTKEGNFKKKGYLQQIRNKLECNWFRRDRNRHYILVYIVAPSVAVALLRGLGDIDEFVLKFLIHIFFGINFLDINLRWWAFGMKRYFDLITYKTPPLVQQATYEWTVRRGIKSDDDMDDQIVKLSFAEKQWVFDNLFPVKPQTLWQKRTLSQIHRAEFWIVWVSLIGMVLSLTFPVLEGYYYLWIQLYLFRLITLVRANQRLIALIFTIIPHTLNILAFLFIFMFWYARIGCSLFGYETDYVLEDVYSTNANANFNTLGSSMLTLLQLMIGEGWHEIMYLNMIATRVEYATYFIVYIVFATLIISNVFIGLFLSEIEDLDQEYAQDEFLSRWMDSLDSTKIAQQRKNKLINDLNGLKQSIKVTRKQIKKVNKILKEDVAEGKCCEKCKKFYPDINAHLMYECPHVSIEEVRALLSTTVRKKGN